MRLYEFCPRLLVSSVTEKSWILSIIYISRWAFQFILVTKWEVLQWKLWWFYEHSKHQMLLFVPWSHAYIINLYSSAVASVRHGPILAMLAWTLIQMWRTTHGILMDNYQELKHKSHGVFTMMPMETCCLLHTGICYFNNLWY